VRLRTSEGYSPRVTSVAASSDAKWLGSGSWDKTVRLWDAASGACVRVFEGHPGAVTSVQFSPGGQILASGSDDGTIRLWHVASGACYAILFAMPGGWVAYSLDGRYKFGGDIRGSFWHIVGLCRFEVGELDLQLPDNADFRNLPPMPSEIRYVDTAKKA